MIANKKLNGEATVILVAALGIMTLGGFIGAKFFGKTAGSKEGTPIEMVENVRAAGQEKLAAVDVKIDRENTEQLDTAQAGVHATGIAIARAAITAPSRELETAAEINQLTQSAIDAGLGKPVDPALMKWFITVIDKKNSDIERERAIGDRLLRQKEDQLIASVKRETALEASREKIAADNARKLSEVEAERDEWALANAVKAQKLDRIWFWIYVAAGVYIAGIVLPMAAKIFPGLSSIASGVSGLISPGIAWAKGKSDKLATDLVALHEESKKYIESMDPAKIDQFKEKVAQWWGEDREAVAEIEKIKENLRT